MKLLDKLWAQKPGANGLRSLPVTIELDNNRTINARLWEQNPNKSSQYAARARAGERLAWIIGDNIFYALVTEQGIERTAHTITSIEIGEYSALLDGEVS